MNDTSQLRVHPVRLTSDQGAPNAAWVVAMSAIKAVMHKPGSGIWLRHQRVGVLLEAALTTHALARTMNSSESGSASQSVCDTGGTGVLTMTRVAAFRAAAAACSSSVGRMRFPLTYLCASTWKCGTTVGTGRRFLLCAATFWDHFEPRSGAPDASRGRADGSTKAPASLAPALVCKSGHAIDWCI